MKYLYEKTKNMYLCIHIHSNRKYEIYIEKHNEMREEGLYLNMEMFTRAGSLINILVCVNMCVGCYMCVGYDTCANMSFFGDVKLIMHNLCRSSSIITKED